MQYQSYICGKNHWRLEPDLKAILSKYWPDLPQHEPSLIEFGAVAGGRAYRSGRARRSRRDADPGDARCRWQPDRSGAAQPRARRFAEAHRLHQSPAV